MGQVWEITRAGPRGPHTSPKAPESSNCFYLARLQPRPVPKATKVICPALDDVHNEMPSKSTHTRRNENLH